MNLSETVRYLFKTFEWDKVEDNKFKKQDVKFKKEKRKKFNIVDIVVFILWGKVMNIMIVLRNNILDKSFLDFDDNFIEVKGDKDQYEDCRFFIRKRFLDLIYQQ